MRTDDELSELEECIDSELREATGKGFTLSAQLRSDRCALAAISWNRRLHNWCRGGAALGLNPDERVSFAWGFDGTDPARVEQNSDYMPALFAMGRRFRERVIAWEYAR